MSIVQISKIQQRAGNIVDLPQLDEAEFGWASDVKRLFIGKTTPNENIEVLTSYSAINFSQINGAVGNLNISNVTVADGQVLTYDGNNWVNRGGDAGGLITLGDVGNVKIDGGAIGYVLETDGLGNLSWTPKSTIVTYIENVTQANPAVVTTTEDNFLTDALPVTITGAVGMTQLNGNTYYIDVLTANTFALYTDPSLTTSVNSTGYGMYAYTTVSATSSSTDQITVANATPFTVNDPVVFSGTVGNSSIVVGQTYYIKTKDTSAPNTWITISETVGGNTFDPGTEASVSAVVYATGGRVVASVGGGGGSGNGAQGSNTSVQYNNNNLLDGDASFTWDFANYILTVGGNANVGNLNATGIGTATRFISNIATGTAPLQVTSTTRVSNLNVAYSNVSDFNVITAQNTGTFYPVFVNGSTTANYALGSNVNVNVSLATGAFNATLLGGTLTTAAQPNITSVGTLTTLNVSGNANTGNLGTTTLIATTGNITTINSGLLKNGTSNVTIASGGNVSVFTAGNATAQLILTSTGANIGGTANVVGNANVGNLGTAGLIVATGNVTGGNLNTGGVLSVTGNANVGNLGTAGLITATGNVTGGNLNTGGVVAATGNVSGGNLVTTGIANVTGNVLAGNVYANSGTVGASKLTGSLTTAAQPNITSVGTLTSLTVSGTSNLGAVGNVTITGGNANQILKTNGSGTLSWTDATGGYYLHTQSSSSNTWTIVHNLNNQYVSVNPIDSTGNSYIGRYDFPTVSYTNANAVTLTFSSAVTGYCAIVGGGFTYANGTPNSTPSGLNTYVQFNDAGTMGGQPSLTFDKTTGTLSATLFAGSGANLTTLNASNISTGTLPSARLSGTYTITVSGSATTAGTVTTAAQPNITSVGTLTGLTVSSTISGSVSGSAATAGTVTTAAQPNITSVGTLTSVTVSGNANIAGNINFTGAKANLGSNANLTITGGSSGQLLSTDGSGALSWVSQGSVIGGAAGSNTQIQYNALGLLAASANFTFNYATNALTVAGNIVSNSTVGGASATLYGTTLTTGANTTAGNITGNWTLTSGSKLTATYADLAEYYEADDVYPWGTVLEFGGDKEVTIATDETKRVAGVVSKNPAYVMNATCPGLLTAVALQGRVPCKVQGSVRKGDIMISAGDGYAKACSAPVLGTVIGKALVDFDGAEGIIEIAVGRL